VTLDRMIKDALPQFFDAGRRCLVPAPQLIAANTTRSSIIAT
jgi:hypothetical protein